MDTTNNHVEKKALVTERQLSIKKILVIKIVEENIQ